MSEKTAKFGHTTADDPRYHKKVNVYLNGEDVTMSCLEADDERGFVVLFTGIEQREGEAHILTETRRGDVRIEWREGIHAAR